MKWVGAVRRLPARRRRAVVEAACLLVVVEVGLRVAGFRRVRRGVEYLAGDPDDSDAGTGALDPDRDIETVTGDPDRDPAVETVGWAVPVAAGRFPWSVTCLVRAVTARTMLGRRDRPARLRIGVRREGGREGGPDGTPGETPTDPPLAAHSWVEVGDRVVVGDHPELDGFDPMPPLP